MLPEELEEALDIIDYQYAKVFNAIGQDLSAPKKLEALQSYYYHYEQISLLSTSS